MVLPGTSHLSENGEAFLQSRSKDLTYSAAMSPGDREVHWYAIRTCSRHEKCVCKHLESRQIICFLPLHTAVHRWRNGCQARVETPLFPNYLFVEIDLRDRLHVLEVPGILSLVGVGNKPVPLPDFEIQSLRSGLHQRMYEPHAYLAVGQKVRIKSGPLENLTGVLVREGGGLRVVISVDLIKQSVAVEVDAEDVEPFTQTSCPRGL